MKKFLLALVLTMISIATSHAEELSRPVVQEYRLEAGGGTALSTYLSPLAYDGKFSEHPPNGPRYHHGHRKR